MRFLPDSKPSMPSNSPILQASNHPIIQVGTAECAERLNNADDSDLDDDYYDNDDEDNDDDDEACYDDDDDNYSNAPRIPPSPIGCLDVWML